MNEIYGKRGIALSLILICALVGVFIGAVATVHPVARALATAVEVSDATVPVGGSDSVDIWVRNFPEDGFGLGCYTIRIDYDPAMIEVTGVSPGDAPFDDPIYNIEADYVSIAQFIMVMPGPTGDIRICDLEFTCLAQGETTLALTIETLANTDGVEIPATPINGTITQQGIPALDADFTADDTTVMVFQPVHFYDLTVGGVPPYSYAWDFGDGQTSDEPNPTHAYYHDEPDPVTYTVSLTVTDSEFNTDTETKVDYITVAPHLSGTDFVATPTVVKVGETVTFTDLTKGGFPPYSYEWDFDDDRVIDSTIANPTHCYAAPRLYTVLLRVTDSDGNVDREMKADYIRVMASGGAGGGGGGGAPPRGPELEVNMMGRVASGSVTEEGKLEEIIEVTSRDGVVTLHLPEGILALDSEGNRLEEITVDPVLEPSALLEKWYVIGTAYDFGPDGATFNPSIDLIIRYDPEGLPEGVNEEDLVIACYHNDSGEWRLLEPSVVDMGADTVTSSIGDFTVFAVIGRMAPAFTLADLSISPSEVDPGESVTISVQVTNSGGMEASYLVVLVIDGTEEATQQLTLAPGESDAVTFTVTKEEAGIYEVTVDGLSGSFTVTAAQFLWWAVWLGVGLSALLLAAITAYLLIWRRKRATA